MYLQSESMDLKGWLQ